MKLSCYYSGRPLIHKHWPYVWCFNWGIVVLFRSWMMRFEDFLSWQNYHQGMACMLRCLCCSTEATWISVHLWTCKHALGLPTWGDNILYGLLKALSSSSFLSMHHSLWKAGQLLIAARSRGLTKHIMTGGKWISNKPEGLRWNWKQPEVVLLDTPSVTFKDIYESSNSTSVSLGRKVCWRDSNQFLVTNVDASPFSHDTLNKQQEDRIGASIFTEILKRVLALALKRKNLFPPHLNEKLRSPNVGYEFALDIVYLWANDHKLKVCEE